MQALILAGGRGMRLSPLTDDTPPALLYLPGGTLLDYALHHLSGLPIRKAALLLQYRGDQVARQVAARPTVQLLPQHPPFTLLSALASAAAWVEEPTLVFHANLYLARSLDYFLEEADPTVPTFLLPDHDYAAGRVEGAGAYLFPPEAFRVAARVAEAQTLEALRAELSRVGLRPAALPMQGWGQSVRTPTDLLAVNRHLLTHWHDTLHPTEAGVGYDAMNLNWIAPDADVDPSMRGLFTTVGPKARVRRSNLFNTLVWPGTDLADERAENVLLRGTPTSLLRLYAPPPLRVGVARGGKGL